MSNADPNQIISGAIDITDNLDTGISPENEAMLTSEQKAGQILLEVSDILPKNRFAKKENKVVEIGDLTAEEVDALVKKAKDQNFVLLKKGDKLALTRRRNGDYAKELEYQEYTIEDSEKTKERVAAEILADEFEKEEQTKSGFRRAIESLPRNIQKNIPLINALNRQKQFMENFGIYEDPTKDILGIRKYMGLYTKGNYKWGEKLNIEREDNNEQGIVKIRLNKEKQAIDLNIDNDESELVRKQILKSTGLGEGLAGTFKNIVLSPRNAIRTLGEGIELGLTAAAMIGGGIQMSKFMEKGAQKGMELAGQNAFVDLSRMLNWGRLPIQRLLGGVKEWAIDGNRSFKEFFTSTVLSLPATAFLLFPGTYFSEGSGILAGSLANKLGLDVMKSRMADRAMAWTVRRSLSTFAPVLMFRMVGARGLKALGYENKEIENIQKDFSRNVSAMRSLALLVQFQLVGNDFLDKFSIRGVRQNLETTLGSNNEPNQLEQFLPQAKGRPGLPTPGKGGKAGEFMGFEETTKSPVEIGEKGNLLDEKLENLKPFEKGPPRGPVPIDDPLKWGIPRGHVRSGVIEEHLIINNGIAPMEVVREGSHFGDINVFADGQNVPMEIVMDGDGHILGFIDQRSPSPQLIPLQGAGGGVIAAGFGPLRHEGLGVIPGGDQVFAANMDTDPGLEYIVFRNGPGANDVLQVQYIIDISIPAGAPAPVAGTPIVGNLIYSADGSIPNYGPAGMPLPTGLPSGLVLAPPGGISTAGLPITMPPTSAGALPPGFVGGPAVGAPAAPGAAAPGVVSSGYGTTSPAVVSWITGAGSSFENERQTAVFIAQHVLADLNGGVRPEDYGLDSAAFASMTPTDKEAIALDIARRIVQGQDPAGPTYADVNAGKYFTGGVGTSAIPDTTKLDTLVNDFKTGVITGTEGPMAINYYPGTTNVDPFWDGAVGKLNAATATPGVVGPGALPGVPAAGAGVITPGGGLIGAGGTPIMPAVEVTYTPVVGGAPITVTIMPWDHHNDPAIIAALQASGYETNWQQVNYGDQVLYWAENSDDGVNGAIIYGGNGVPLDPNNGIYMSRAFKDGELVMVNGMYFDNQGGALVEITENDFLKRMRDVDLTKAAAVLGLSLIGLGALGALATRTIFRTGRGRGNNNPPNIPPQNLQQQQQPPQQPPANANAAGGGGLGNAAAPVVVPPQPMSNFGNNTNTDSFNNEMNIQPGAFQITNNVDLTPIADAMNGMAGIMQQMLNIIAQQQPGAGGGVAAGNPAANPAPAQGVVVQITPGGGLLIQAPDPNAAINLVNALQPLYGQANLNPQPLAGAQAPGGQPATGIPPQAMPNNPVPYIYYQAPGGPVAPWPANIPLPPGVNQVPAPGGQYVPPQTTAGNQATVGNPPLRQTQGPSNFTVEQGAPYITIQYPNGQQTLWNSNNPLPDGAHPVGGGMGAGDDKVRPPLRQDAYDENGEQIFYQYPGEVRKIYMLEAGQRIPDGAYRVTGNGVAYKPVKRTADQPPQNIIGQPKLPTSVKRDKDFVQIEYNNGDFDIIPTTDSEKINQILDRAINIVNNPSNIINQLVPPPVADLQALPPQTARQTPASISGEGRTVTYMIRFSKQEQSGLLMITMMHLRMVLNCRNSLFLNLYLQVSQRYLGIKNRLHHH